ncbi:MAG: hypothetical protein CMI14_10345 [Oleispira sp.]|nr:hypothetical protein [Oleispira sp.]
MNKIICVALLCLGATGCSTVYMDSASAKDGGRYVSGSHNGQKVIFYCPAKDSNSDCVNVDIDYK